VEKYNQHGQPAQGLIRLDFEGEALAFYTFRGRPCVVAADVGRALGYADSGKGLASAMRKEWADEMIDGKDFGVLTGDDLRQFKAFSALAGDSPVSQNARDLTVLYESGVDLVCIKTEKPAGRRLRRFLADEVLPKLRRDEPIVPAAASSGLTREELFAIITESYRPMQEALTALATSMATTSMRLATLETRAGSDARTGPAIGAKVAREQILDPINALARDRAIVIREPSAWRKLRPVIDQEVRAALTYPMTQAARWEALPHGQLGYALVKLASMRAAVVREAKIASVDLVGFTRTKARKTGLGSSTMKLPFREPANDLLKKAN